MTTYNNLPRIDASGVATLFVGGASAKDIISGVGEREVKNYFDSRQNKGDTKYTTHNSFSIGGLSIFNNISNGKKTILIGHSWGADEVLDYGDFQPVNLAITIDPVDFVDSWEVKVNTHINVTDLGSTWSISWHRYTICKYYCWGWCCNQYGSYPSFSSNWNGSDWVAYFGSKYRNYFWMGNWVTDDGFTYHGHHNEFENMLYMVKSRYPSIGIKQ